MAVELGEGGADTWRFHEEMGVDCGTSDSEYCMLSSLCEASLPEGADPSAYTPTEAWCALEEAGKLAQTLLWLGFIPGIGTMFLTLLFAAKEIGKVGTYLSKAEKQGISMTIQKYAISACWVGLWAFLFISMVAYAAEVPDGLGVGLISLEASFGVVRLSFLLVSIFGSLLIVSLFDMWRADGFIEVSEPSICRALRRAVHRLTNLSNLCMCRRGWNSQRLHCAPLRRPCTLSSCYKCAATCSCSSTRFRCAVAQPEACFVSSWNCEMDVCHVTSGS